MTNKITLTRDRAKDLLINYLKKKKVPLYVYDVYYDFSAWYIFSLDKDNQRLNISYNTPITESEFLDIYQVPDYIIKQAVALILINIK